MKQRTATLAERRKYNAEYMRKRRKDATYYQRELAQQRMYRKLRSGMPFPAQDGDNYRYIGRVAGHGTLLQLIRWLP